MIFSSRTSLRLASRLLNAMDPIAWPLAIDRTWRVAYASKLAVDASGNCYGIGILLRAGRLTWSIGCSGPSVKLTNTICAVCPPPRFFLFLPQNDPCTAGNSKPENATIFTCPAASSPDLHSSYLNRLISRLASPCLPAYSSAYLFLHWRSFRHAGC